jgi:hypothetical protein
MFRGTGGVDMMHQKFIVRQSHRRKFALLFLTSTAMTSHCDSQDTKSDFYWPYPLVDCSLLALENCEQIIGCGLRRLQVVDTYGVCGEFEEICVPVGPPIGGCPDEAPFAAADEGGTCWNGFPLGNTCLPPGWTSCCTSIMGIWDDCGCDDRFSPIQPGDTDTDVVLP